MVLGTDNLVPVIGITHVLRVSREPRVKQRSAVEQLWFRAGHSFLSEEGTVATGE